MATSRIRRRQAKPKSILPSIVGGVAALVVAGVIMYMIAKAPKRDDRSSSAGGRTEGPDSRAREPIDADAPHARFKEMLSQAKKYAEQHPNEFDVLVRMFKDVETEAEGTDYAREAGKRRKEVEAARKAAVKSAWRGLRAEVDKLAKAGRYREAARVIHTLSGIPAHLKGSVGEARTKEALASLSSQASFRFEMMRTKAHQLLNMKKLDEAVKLLASAKAWGVDEVARQVDQSIKELREEEVSTRHELEKKAATLYYGAFSLIALLVKDREYGDALEQCEEWLTDPRYKFSHDCLRAGRRDLERAKEVHDAAKKALVSHVGRELLIGGVRGTLVEVKGDELLVESGDVKLNRRISELKAQEVVDLALPAMKQLGGEESLCIGLFFFFEGEAEQAIAALGRAKARGIDISSCKKRMSYLDKPREPWTSSFSERAP